MKNKDINVPDISFDEIDLIVNKGVKPKQSFICYLKDCFRELGFNNIFHDKTELFIICLISIVMLTLSMSNIDSSNVKGIYEYTFVISPIIYLMAVLFSFFNSKEKGAFEIEMTCKYNLYQLSALRMFLFSIGSILINTSAIIFLWLKGRDIDVIRMIVISITGLFLFSTMFLYSLFKFKYALSKYFVVTIWIIVNMSLSNLNSNMYEVFLINTPLYIHIIISITCMVLYIKNLEKLINYRRKRGEVKC